jgi:hypothetical protein
MNVLINQGMSKSQAQAQVQAQIQQMHSSKQESRNMEIKPAGSSGTQKPSSGRGMGIRELQEV